MLNIMVKVEYRAEMFALCKVQSEELDVKTVAEAIKAIEKKYGKEAKKEAKKMLIVVDGTSINLLKHYKTELKDGQILSFLPICGGG